MFPQYSPEEAARTYPKTIQKSNKIKKNSPIYSTSNRHPYYKQAANSLSKNKSPARLSCGNSVTKDNISASHPPFLYIPSPFESPTPPPSPSTQPIKTRNAYLNDLIQLGMILLLLQRSARRRSGCRGGSFGIGSQVDAGSCSLWGLVSLIVGGAGSSFGVGRWVIVAIAAGGGDASGR